MMRRVDARVLGSALALFLVCAADAAWAQCPMCRTALLASDEGQRLAAGFNRAILFLLGVPFAILAVFTVWILRALRRSPLLDERQLKSERPAVSPAEKPLIVLPTIRRV